MTIIEIPVTHKYEVKLASNRAGDQVVQVYKNDDFINEFKADVPLRVIHDCCNIPQLVQDEVSRQVQHYRANRPISVDARAYTTSSTCTGHKSRPAGAFTFNVSGPDADALQDVFKRKGPNGVVRLRVDTDYEAKDCSQ